MRLLIAVLFGGAACIGLDYLHATHGVTRYFRADLFGVQPWWVLLLFPAAVFATVVMVEPMRKLLRGAPIARPSFAVVTADFVLFVGAYAVTSWLHDRPTLVMLILWVVWVGRVLGRAPWWVVVYSLGSGLSGFAVEATLVALGQFAYQHPDVVGVARWLPGIYLHAGLLGVTLAGYVRRSQDT